MSVAPEKPLLGEIKREVGALAADVRESLRLRWQLAQWEVARDLRSLGRLAVALAVVATMGLATLPLVAACLAVLLGGWLGISVAGWLAIFGVGFLVLAVVGGLWAWRRFRRRFVGLQQTLEELREDLVWLAEWSGREDGDRDA